MTFEEIKPDINREMLTAPCLGVSVLTVVRWARCPLFPCPYHILNRAKTRLEGSQRNVLALFRLHDAI